MKQRTTNDMPIHDGERLRADVEPGGVSWVIPPGTHVGHTMTVLGVIERDGEIVPMVVVECSCGDRFRMARTTVERVIKSRVRA